MSFMRNINIILWLSLVISLLPFLGFPQIFDDFIYVVSGAIIFILVFLLKNKASAQRKTSSDESVEKKEFKTENIENKIQ